MTDPTRGKRAQRRPRDSYPPLTLTHELPTIRVTLDDLEALDVIANALGVGKGEAVRRLIRANDPRPKN